MTIASQLTLLSTTKDNIKDAIETKGVTVGNIPFSQYPGKIAEIQGGEGPGPVEPAEWDRPTDWLAMPAISDTDCRFDGLVAVNSLDELNWVTVQFNQAYTVDWGDGLVENYAANAVATHQFIYDEIDSNTLTTRGYRQALVSVTPQGSNWTSGSIHQLGSTPYPTGTSTRWLDIQLAQNNTGSFTVRNPLTPRLLERFRWLGSNSMTSMSNMFNDCRSLQSLELDTSGVSAMTFMFQNCLSLLTIPQLDTSNVTRMDFMFSDCTGLRTIPQLDTSNVTNMHGMFFVCRSLLTIPQLDVSNVNTMLVMFQNCTNLQTIPQLDTSSVTNMSNKFSGCAQLQRIQSTGYNVTFSLQNCRLGPDALVEIFENLADRTGLSSLTVTITGNWGAALLTQAQRDIALNKNWTISG